MRLHKSGLLTTSRDPMHDPHCIHFDGERELVRTELEKSNLILSEENILHPDRKGLCKELILAFVEAINRIYYI